MTEYGDVMVIRVSGVLVMRPLYSDLVMVMSPYSEFKVLNSDSLVYDDWR